ncbi:lipopolysaccharide biosynthesis protein [Halomarina ordinaria]|uniref:Lipopolysaccharide biosynthesis protein n=1 Tax=Halomarina ordinaria TaxID=3033939 RepID=A0ABD5U6A4_9EURY|nr:lipopolysaccharide biosynthesis protein [Halomarina sp. PSRA2]
MSRSIVRGFLSVLSTDVLVLLLSLVITPLLVRILTPGQYGEYAFVMTVLTFTMIFVNAGLFDGIRKYLAEETRAPEWQGQVFGYYTRVGTVVALVAALLVLASVWTGAIARLFGTEFERYFLLLAALVVIRQFWAIGRATLMGLGLEHLSEPVKVARWVVFALVGLPLAAIGLDVVGLLLGRIVARFVVLLVAFGLVFRYLSPTSLLTPAPEGFPRRELLSYNAFSVVLVFLLNSLYSVDVLLLTYFTESAQVGYYNAALVVAEFLWFVPLALQTVLLQSTSGLWSRAEHDAVTEVASRATRYCLLLTTLMCLGLLALADTFVPLYFGAEYTAAILPLLLLLPGSLGFALARPIFAIGQGKGALRLLAVATGAAALLNLLLNLVLIPRYGTAGAAVSTSIGYGSMLAFHVWCAGRIGFDPLSDLRLLRVTATAALSAPVIFGLDALLANDWAALAVVPPAGFLVYAALAVGTGAIDGAELTELRRYLPAPLTS